MLPAYRRSWAAACDRAASSPDPVVRATAVREALRALRLGGSEIFCRGRSRPRPPQGSGSRPSAASSSLDNETALVAEAAGRPRARGPRLGRSAASASLGQAPSSAATWPRLAGDPDPLVRAAALESSVERGRGPAGKRRQAVRGR